MGNSRFSSGSGETSEATRHGSYPLEPSGEEMRRLLDAAAQRIVRHIETLGDQPSVDLEGSAEVAASVREPWPSEPQPFEQLLDQIFDRLAPKSFNTAGPGFMAYIPGGGLFYTALADLIAETINRYTTVWTAAPGLAQLEINVVRWFSRMVGYPASAGGFLSSGGSIANFSALVAARQERLGENFLAGTVYASKETHHSIAKALLLAGFPSRNLRQIAVDEHFRMRPDALAEQIAKDRREGLEPFFLVGNAGSTNTGAIDPLEELAELARVENLWFHVDAAYGGFFALTTRGKQRLAGMERAESITLDPHKSLFLPYGTGCLLVRDVETLRRSHAGSAEYMPPMQEDPDRVDFSAISPELSRGNRGLRVWLPFKLLGVEPFRVALDEKLDLAQWAERELQQIPGIELVAKAQLSILAFRWVPPVGEAGEALDALNRRLLDAINQRKRVMLTGTSLAGPLGARRFVIRICVLNFRTHRDRMELCLEDIRSAIIEVLK